MGNNDWKDELADRRRRDRQNRRDANRPRRKPGEGLRMDIGGGEHLTVNSTDNPAVGDGGWYQTTTNDKGEKSTAVYDSDGNMPSGKDMGDNDKYR